MLHYISKGTIQLGSRDWVDVYVLNDNTHVFELISITKFITGDYNLSLHDAFYGVCGDIFNPQNVPVIEFGHPFDRSEGVTRGYSTDTFHLITVYMSTVKGSARAGDIKLTPEQNRIADKLIFFAQTAEEIGNTPSGTRNTLH